MSSLLDSFVSHLCKKDSCENLVSPVTNLTFSTPTRAAVDKCFIQLTLKSVLDYQLEAS